jgi:branched-chain amino acid transport system permease protein
MTEYLSFLILGSAAGAIIAALSLGLVACQQASGVVNFGLGAIVTWTAHVYAELRNGAYVLPFPGLPDRYHFNGDVGFVWAVVLSLATTAVLALVLHRLIFAPLHRAPSLSTVVASVGIIIVLSTLVARRFPEAAAVRVDDILPNEPVNLFDGVIMPRDGLWLSAIVVGLGVLAWLVSNYTRIGLVTRAASTNEKGVMLLGYSPNRLAEVGFVVVTVVVGFVAILASPMIRLSPVVFTFGYLIPALGAALAGKFKNIGVTLFVAFAIGMVQSTFSLLQLDYSWFPRIGAREGLPFLVIVAAVAFRGEAIPDRGTVDSWRLPNVPEAKVSFLRVAIPVALAVGALLFFGPLWRAAIMTSTIGIVFALSFVVLTGMTGETSLAQMTIAGTAGFALSKLASEVGIPFPIAPLIAALVATCFGVLVGIPSLRVRGTNLAIVTLGGSVAISEFVFKNPDYVGDTASGGALVPNPSIFGWDFGLVLGTTSSRPVFGIFLVGVVTVLCLMVANIRGSTTGRRMLAARSNERAARAAGINTSRVKLQSYALSSFIAGIGGCLIAYRFGRVSDGSFGTVASLTALAVAYLGGITTVSGAVTAGILASSGVGFFALHEVIGGLGEWEIVIGGVLLIFTVVVNPDGVAAGFRRDQHKSKKKADNNDGAEAQLVASA